LFLYLTVSESAISRALFREDGGVQKSIYYVSKSLLDEEIRYQRMEKMVLAHFVVSRKLNCCFHSFQIFMLTKHPLRSIWRTHKPQGE